MTAHKTMTCPRCEKRRTTAPGLNECHCPIGRVEMKVFMYEDDRRTELPIAATWSGEIVQLEMSYPVGDDELGGLRIPSPGGTPVEFSFIEWRPSVEPA